MPRKFKPKGKRVNATGRSEVTERFARLPHSILESEAYRSLDPTARALLAEIVMLDNGRNNGSLWLSIKDGGQRIGVVDARPTMKAFDSLQNAGLIRMTKEAHFSIKAAETSRARCWRLTWLSFDGKPPSNEWKTYQAPAQTKERKRADSGLRALARYRKEQSAHKMPVVDFTAISPKPA